MKIHFNNLGKSDNAIKISFDGGNSFREFNVNDIQRNKGIHLDDSQDYSKIKIIGKSSVIRDLDVVKDIDIPNNAFYLVVGSSYVKSIEYDGCGQESFSDGCGQDYFYDGCGQDYDGCGQESFYDGCGEDSYYDGCGSDSYSVDDGYGGNDSSFLGNVEAILVSPLWLKNVFNVDNFDPEFLSISNYPVQPFAYATDETPILYRIPYEPNSSNNFVGYDDGTTRKFFKVSPVESENVAKDYPKFQLFFGDELVYEEQTTYVDNIRNIIQETIIDRHPEEFDGYDWKIYVNSEYSKSIMDKQFYMDSRYITEDYIIKIQDKQEHVYHYNAQYTEDNSRFSISWTKSTPALPDNPTKPFASFVGWYQDSSFSTPLNLGNVDDDGWIYAKWEYHDVTRKVIFEVPGLHLEFNVTRASNVELYMNDLISNIRSQDKNNCIKDISLRGYNYNRMYFNTEEDFIIPANTFNVTFNKKTITLNYTDGTSKNFDYYNKPCTLGCKYEDLIPTGEKSILQSCEVRTTNSSYSYLTIDSQESLDNYVISKGSTTIQLYEGITVVPSRVEVEFTNIEKSNATPRDESGYNYIGLDCCIPVDVYISGEYIDASNYENGMLLESNIQPGMMRRYTYDNTYTYEQSHIENAFTKIKNLKNSKSIPGFKKVYLYCKPLENTGSIKFSYLNKEGTSATTSIPFEFGKNIVVPSTYEQLDELFNNALSTSRYSCDIDTSIPDEHTYKIWFEYLDYKNYVLNKYNSLEIININEIPSSKTIYAYYVPVAINYQPTVKSITRDLIGREVEGNDVEAEISFEEEPTYSTIRPTVTVSNTSCNIVDIENCIKNSHNKIFRTPYEVPMKFTIKDGTFTPNFFYGKGSNNDAKNYILEHLDIPFYNGLGEELTVDQKQKILSKLPPDAFSYHNSAMVTENYVNNIKRQLPSEGDYASFIINKDQLNLVTFYPDSTTKPSYVFYYGNDYDDTFSDWVIPSTTKYVELYFDVNEERYYDRNLIKVYNVTDTNKIRSMSDETYHNVNPDTYETYKDFKGDVKFTCKDLMVKDTNKSYPYICNVNTISYDNKDWLNDVIAGENVKINGETIKYIVNIDDKCYYKAKVEDGKVHLDLNENNWFEYNADLYQLSDVMPKVLFSNNNFSFYRLNNKEIFAKTSSSYYKLSSIEFYGWKKNEGIYNGMVSTNGSNSSSFVGTSIDFNNIKLCILYKKGTGATFVPRNLKYCIVEADAVEEVVEPVPEGIPTPDEPTGGEENLES